MTAECEDHTEVDVGEIANYYGCLSLRRTNGVDQWSIENWDGHHWHEIPATLADELRKLVEPEHLIAAIAVAKVVA